MKHFFFLFILLYFFAACTSPEKEEVKSTKANSKSISRVSKNWKGKWEREVWGNQATLEITKIKGNKITFRIFAISGANIAELKGTAKVKGDKAVFKESHDCTIEFKLTDDYIEVDQITGSCAAGNGVAYTGKYMHEKYTSDEEMTTDLAELKVLTQQEDMIFRELVGDKYTAFVNSTHMITNCHNIDDSLHVKVTCHGVRGMLNVLENIIMVDENHKIWAAVLSDGKVYYFTNDENFKNQLPRTIDKWREDFKEIPIVY